ncbi:M15 family metallopeptidase [Candidatus Saccharibacteria bacterium]|nr:M15 family metallopeptidase [Candidatus Saccharibacteria bacterium]
MSRQYAERPHGRNERSPLDGGPYGDWGSESSFDTTGSRAVSDGAQDAIDDTDGLLGDHDNPGGSSYADEPGANNPERLRELESRPDEGNASDATSYEDDKLGRGYSGSGKRTGRVGPMSPGAKRGMTIFGVGLGATVFSAIFAFISMIPLRIEAMVRNFEQQYLAVTYENIERISMNIFTDYITYVVMPGMTGSCHKTVDPSCSFVAPGTDPINRFYQSWIKAKVEVDLAENHGLIIGREGGSTTTKKFYMNIDGKKIDITDLQSGKVSLYDLPGTKEVSRAEIRRAVMGGLDKSLHPKAAYKRFVVNAYLKRVFGIRFCDQHCKWYEGTRNKIDATTASYQDKKLSYKVWALQRFAPEKYQVVIGCVLDVNQCVDTLDPATKGDPVRMSPAQKELSALVSKASIDVLSDNDLTKLAAKAREAGDIGVQEYVVREATRKVIAVMLGEAAAESFGNAAGQAVSKSIPIIGWIVFGAKVIHFVDAAPEVWQYTTYALQASTALGVAAHFQSNASEMESGNVDETMQGAIDLSLTADALDSGEFASDMTDTPLYGALSGITSTPGLGFLSPKAYAAGVPSRYLCDDGEPVNTAKSLTCEEESLAQTSEFLTGLKASMSTAFPGLSTTAGIIDTLWGYVEGLFPGEYIVKAFQKACGLPTVVQASIGVLPLCLLADKIGDGIDTLVQKLYTLIPNLHRGDGGRTYDVAAAGFDVMGNRSVRDTLGGVVATPEQITAVRDRYIASQKADFQSRPLLSRLFAEDTPYSLVSRIALTTPKRDTQSVFVALLKNTVQPVRQIDASVARLGQKQAFASSPMIATAFGVTQYIVPEVPLHPGEYFRTNCLQRYDEATGVLDSSDFLNNETVVDPKTGEQMNTTPNTCALVHSGLVAMGALTGGITLPPDTSATSSGGGTGDTGDLFADSTKIPCYDDPGTSEVETKDLGEQDGYNDGQKVRIRVCAISNIASDAGESNPGDTYFISGADGRAVINSRLSESAFKLGQDMAASIGQTPRLASAFRSMAKQESLCAANYQCRSGDFTYVAQPGFSNHQMGLAFDFSEPSGKASTSSCEGRATDPGSAVWRWLEANARRYGGLQQYANEAWHWDPLGGANRCGGGPAA